LARGGNCGWQTIFLKALSLSLSLVPHSPGCQWFIDQALREEGLSDLSLSLIRRERALLDGA